MRISDWSSDVCSSDLSVANALAVAAGTRAVNVVTTGAPEEVRTADRVILPGVGAFGQCAAALRALPGMEDALEEAVVRKSRPFLGICVGMQLMADSGQEHGVHKGLGWIGGDVVRLQPADKGLKIPHMGRSEEHTSELQSLMRISYAVF